MSDGWIEVSPVVVQDHSRACESLPTSSEISNDIKGTDIPEALLLLSPAATKDGSWNTPWSVYFSQSVKDSHRIVDSPAVVQFRLNIVESDGQSLLELDPIYNHERFQLTHAEAETATEAGEAWFRRRDAWIKVDVNKHQSVASEFRALGLHRTEEGFTFPASRREEVIEVFSTLGSVQHSTAYADFVAKLANFEKIDDEALPDSLRPEIDFRPYQKHGFNWLAFLHKFGLNGILADDMGLGKTLQCLAVIQRAKERTKANLPSLIICPTSVVSNWKAEAYKFFLRVQVLMYTGSDRAPIVRRIRNLMTQDARDADCLLVVTTYDIAAPGS